MVRGFLALAVLLLGGAVGRDAFDHWVAATVLPPLLTTHSVEVLDREGALLRAYTVEDGRWRMATTLDAIDPGYLAMLVRYEDKRFRDHAGVDLRAMARASAQALSSGRIRSGGSTLTMQVARLLEGGTTGAWGGKLRQIRVALALERRLGKDAILTLYVNHAPFGGNIEGVRAAYLAWFGKPPTRMTPAQAALLVALPQSPELRRPDRDPAAARSARDRVLDRMVSAGLIDAGAAQAARTEAVPTKRIAVPALAPHLADRIRRADPFVTRHESTLDAGLQRRIAALAEVAVRPHSDRLQIAIMVADHYDGAVLASVGSAAFTGDARQGFVDMTRAVRSPGSTLKPLIYGLAFDRGLAHPETLIADAPTDFNGYRPVNFDGLWRGEVRLRDALRLSLNLPVVSLTEAMAPQHLIAGLRRAGARPVLDGQPGLAVSLGGVGLTLEDLMRLYAGLAQGGRAVDLHWLEGERDGFAAQRIVGPVAAWQVADILRETPRPVGVQGSGIAFKTGTSYGHRDAWAMGFDGRHVVGVWMGRADGTQVPGAFGGELAAPVLFAAFERLGRKTPLRSAPPATLIVPTARLPQPLQRFRPRNAPATGGPKIAFPPDGAAIEGESLVVKIRDGLAPFTWLANGQPVLTTRAREAELPPLGLGFSALTVIDAAGQSAAARVEVRQ